jgi:ribosomal-protein-alanine N-acetyltransferase
MTTDVHIRWMIRRDMPEVLAIEAGSFAYPWDEEGFVHCLRNRNCIGMVAEHDERTIAFMIYELHRRKLHVLNFAVHPDWRRRGVGAAMVRKLVSKLNPGAERRHKLVLEVRETNMGGQLFLRAMGFRAASLLREFYDDSGEDAYLFEYRLGMSAKAGVA